MTLPRNIMAVTALTSTRDIQVLKTYGAAPYAAALKKLEAEIKAKQTSVNEKIGKWFQILDCEVAKVDRCHV